VAAGIIPWNVPQFIVALEAAPALTSGSTIVVKPAPETPLDAYLLGEIIEQSGLPAGVMNIVPAGREVGEHLIRHPDVDKVSCTGSTAADIRHTLVEGRERSERIGQDAAVLDHLSIQCADVSASSTFYDAVLAPLGGGRILEIGEVVGFGVPPVPDFWLGPRSTGDGFRESHIAFRAPNRAAVREFFGAAVDIGAEVLHEPQVWPDYHANYYGAFVRDPDGNNVEAVCHTVE